MAGRKLDPSLILGTANRCPLGCPRVIVCSPLSGAGTPFPTTFWLTCPWLTRLVSSVEADGGVGELERWLTLQAEDRDIRTEWLRFHEDHQLARDALVPPERLPLRLPSGGIGGTPYDVDSPIYVKCLHLHTASWLAFNRHPGEEWLASRIDIIKPCRAGTKHC